MQPTLDSPHTPAVIDTLLTAAEHVEWMRNEGDKERDKLSVQRPPPLTHQDDEVSRFSQFVFVIFFLFSTSLQDVWLCVRWMLLITTLSHLHPLPTSPHPQCPPPPQPNPPQPPVAPSHPPHPTVSHTLIAVL